MLLQLRSLLLFFFTVFVAVLGIHSYTFVDKNKSYLHLKQWDMDSTGSLKFRFKSIKDYGLIMYTDTSRTASYEKSYIALKLNQGHLEVAMQMGADDYRSLKKVTLGASQILNDMEWHEVEIKRDALHPRATDIRLDNEEKSFFHDGENAEFKLNSGLFFGGIPPDLDNMVDGMWSMEPR